MLLSVILVYLHIQYVKPVMVPVKQGILVGEQLLTVTGDIKYNSFKGIPYAAPPVGKLRFQAPRPPAPWQGIRNATQHGNICTQIGFNAGEVLLGNEDCLYLNIYSPNLMPVTQLAVMVFIHGGGFQNGSGNSDQYGPDFFMSQNVILVTINYRLNVFGFLNLESKEVPGNAGMKDQVAALEWIQQNIAQFGGNPKKVTIIGHSAGGVSCYLHAISPRSKGLFIRAISQSGTPFMDFAIDFKSKLKGIALGKLLGYETNNTTALFNFFLKVPAYRFLDTRPYVIIAEKYINNEMKMSQYVPVVEKNLGQARFLSEPPIESILNKRVNDVGFIAGYTNAEGLLAINDYEEFLIYIYNRYPELLTPRWFLYQRNQYIILKLSDSIKKYYFGTRPISINAMRNVVNYFTDTWIYQILRYVRDSSSVDTVTFLYRFSAVTERNVYGRLGFKYGIFGAHHRDILMYLFQNNIFNLPINVNSVSYRIIKQITTLFANFAKYGNPTPDTSLGVIWEQYNATTENYLNIDAELVPRTQPEADMITFWKTIYQRADIPFYYVQNT